MLSAILWILYLNENHIQSETSNKRDMGVLLISLLTTKKDVEL